MRPFRALGAGALLWLTLSAPAPADDSDPFSSPYSRDELVLYFDRADRAAGLEQWLQIMEIPMAAVPEWERERVERDYEARLAAFLRRTWRGSLEEPDLSGFLDLVEEADRKYLFVTDASGRISRDAVGDPLLRAADQADSDHRRWREELGAAVQTLVSRWEQEAEVSFHEILTLLEPGSRSRVGAGSPVTLQEYCAEVRREFERLYRQAESRFLSTRLRDRYSLRSKSESRTAGEVADELIRSTWGELEGALETLELDPQEQYRGDPLAPDPQRWQEEFLGEFERGIEAWTRAEQHLLEQRIRWESDARNAFVEGEEAWDRAFGELERARAAWAEEMNRCLGEGRLAWDLAEQGFIEQFAAVTAELAESARAELDRLHQEVGVLVGVHRQCVDLIELAEGNAGLLAREIESVRGGVAGEAEQGGSLQVLLEELEYWQGENGDGGMLGKYREAAEAARGALLDLEARIRAYGGADLPADSLEREIARLEAERAYLERQVEIAAAVVDYAEDASPDRPSEAKTSSSLARAQEEMAESGQRYAEAVEALRRLVREEVTTAPLELTAAREALEEARSALDQSRRRYGDAWSAWGAQDLAILQALVEQHDQALERWYSTGRSETYRGYFAAWEAFQAAELADQAQELLRDLLGQGEDDRVPDVGQLQARTEALLAVRLDWSEAELWERVRDALSAAGVDPESSAAIDLREALEAGLGGDLVGRLRAEHQLALLRESARVGEYRYACLAELLGRGTLSAEQGEAEIEAVRSAAGEAEAAYAEAREELERQALRCLEGDFSAASPEAAALAELLGLVGAGGAGAAGTGVDEGGDERFQLDGLDLRELFLEEERLRLREAQAVLELYGSFGRMLPLLSSYYRWSDAVAWSAALGVEEEAGELGALRSLTSSERLVELCGELALLPSAPPFLEEVVVRVLAVAAAGRELLADELAAGEAGTGAREWLAAVGAVEVVDDRLAADLEAYAALVLEALAAFRSPDWSRRATQAEAREAQLAVWSGERSITECLAARLQAEAARAAWAEGFSGYQEAVLEPLQEELAERETAVARCQAEYDQALARVASVSARYLELHAALEAALAEHTEARLVLQQAEEVHAYASNGYRLEASGPEAVLAERRQSLDQVAGALEVLRAIDPLELQRPFFERMDPEYRDGKEAESALLEGLQQLVAAREGMESATADLRDLLDGAAERLSRAALEVFSFTWSSGEGESLLFRPDAAALESAELTDFAVGDEQALAEAVAGYFAGDRLEVSERFSTDVVRWLLGMASYGDGCAALLSQFGAAYYYDAVVQEDLQVEDAPGVSIGILSAPSLQALIGPRYLDLGERWVEVCVGGREDRVCHQEYRYPEDKLTVEDYLARVSKSVYEQLAGDPRAGRLYAFFKAMLASGHLAEGTRFVGKDLSDRAYRYVDAKAAALQSSLGQWWKFLISPIWGIADLVKAQAIRDLRSDLATRQVSGASDRAFLSAAASEAEQSLSDRHSAAAALELLCGGEEGEGVDGQSFLKAIADHSGRAAVPALETIVDEELSRLNTAQGRNALSVLDALQEKLEGRLAAVRSGIQEVAAGNLGQREAAYRDYQQLLYGASVDRGALEAAARTLYLNPEFTAEDFRNYELESAAGNAAWSPRGESLRLQLVGQALVGLMQQRLEVLQGAAHERLLLQLRELGDRRAAWERTVGEILAVGSAAWRESADGLVQSRMHWYREFEGEYYESRAAWEAAQLLLQENRDLWVRESTRASVLAGAEAIARDVGLEADRLAADTELLWIPDMTVPAPDPGRGLREVLDGSALSRAVDQARALVARAGVTGMAVAGFLPQLFYSPVGQFCAQELAANVGEEIYRRAALATALQMRRAVEQAERAAIENIAEANAGVEESLSDTMASAGYNRSGREFRRLALIDHTLLAGTERETQSVPVFVYFVAPPVDLGVDLSREALEGRSGNYIQAVVSVAEENLQRYMKLIFGRGKEEREQWSWSGVGEELKSLFDSRMAEFRSSAGYDRKYLEGARKGGFMFHDTEGLFNLHIGYEPVMDDEEPEQVKVAGFGELGRIMAPFLRNEARLARGVALLAMPWYNQRLWDDDADNDGEADAVIAAPTVRSLTNIVVSIAATATGQVWLAAAVNLMDDFVFTMADVASGFLESDQAFLSFAKQAVVSIATTGIGAGVDALSGLTGAFGQSIVGRTLFQGIETLGSNVTASAIGAVELTGDGLSFDTKGFTEDAFGRQALASFAGVVGGTLVSSTLGKLDLQDCNDVRLSPMVFRVEQIEAFNALAGGAVSAGLEYAVGGETTFNLLNFRDIARLAGWDWFRGSGGQGPHTGSWLSHGLLELHIGSEGVNLSVGQGGADVSLSALAASAGGLMESLGVAGFKIDGSEGRSTLNAVNLLGYSSSSDNLMLARSVFERSIVVEYSSVGAVPGGVPEARGYVNQGDLDSLVIARKLLGGALEGSAQLAALFSHEGTHLSGNRTEALAYMREGRTYLDLMRIFGIGDAAYLDHLSSRILEGRSWLSNVGDRDQAEWFRTDQLIGVRASTLIDYIPFIPLIGDLYRGVATILQTNPYTNAKLPTNAIDERHSVQQAQMEADRLEAAIAVGSLAVAAIEAWTASAVTLREVIAGLFDYNPANATSWYKAVDIALNYAGIALTATELLDRGGIRVDRPEGFEGFKERILGSERYKDIKGYWSIEDSAIFELAEKAGVPMSATNWWADVPELEAQAINELINNFNFVSALYQMGVRDAATVSDLFYKGIPYSVTDPDGTVWFFNSPGFAEANKGLTSDYQDNPEHIRYRAILDRLRDFNIAGRLYRSQTVDPINLDRYDQVYESLVQDGLYLHYRALLWNQYNYYELELFQGDR